jgi:hypothetical protein
MKGVLILFLCAVAASAQQINIDLIPASPHLSLGHANQRWNAQINNLTVAKCITLNGTNCFGGTWGVTGATDVTLLLTGSTLSLAPCALNVQVYQWNGTVWGCAIVGGVGGGSPGGSSNNLQTNLGAGSFGGITNVVPGSVLVSNRAAALPIFQAKPVLDLRDFSGISVGAKIDAACASLSGSQGAVQILSSVGAGTSIVGLPQTCALLDYRGQPIVPNSGSFPISLPASPYEYYKTLTSAPASTNDESATAYFELDHKGGGNYTFPGFKSTYSGITADVFSQGKGQEFAGKFEIFKRGIGEAQGVYSAAYNIGPTPVGGQEPTTVWRGDGGDCINCAGGADAYTLTVASYAAGVLTWVEAGFGPLIGEGMTLVLNQSQYTTGSILSQSGTPPTFVGSGTTWSTYSPAATAGKVCFSMAEQDTAGFQFWYPVTSIASDTSLTISALFQGSQTAYSSAFNGTGSYRLGYCSLVTSAVNSSASQVTVSGYDGWTSGNTFTQWLSPMTSVTSDNIQVNMLGPGVNIAPPIGVQRTLNGGRGNWRGIVLSGNGKLVYGSDISNSLDPNFASTDAVYHFSGALPSGVAGTFFDSIPAGTFNALKIKTASGQATSLQYGQGTLGQWNLTETTGAFEILLDAHAGKIRTGSFQSQIGTGTAPLIVASTTPVANLTVSNHPQVYEAGVLTTAEKIYTNTQTLSGGAATHTLANSFTYTSPGTFGCTCTDQTATAACKAVPASATTVTLAGTGSDVLWLSCSGH